MIPEFERVKKAMEKQTAEREKAYLHSRIVIRESKLAIYAVHKGDLDKARVHLGNCEAEIAKLDSVISSTPKLRYGSAQKVAMQEYVEAKTYYQFSIEGTIPSCTQLHCDEEFYLLGLCDLSGELVRRAINAVVAGKEQEAEKIRAFIDALYGQFLQLDLENGELRKKFDSIKYDLKKLEEVRYQLMLKHDVENDGRDHTDGECEHS